MAQRYWVGGAGTWDNSTTTQWSLSSGGVGGASVPGTGDVANFDSLSGGGTVTLNYNVVLFGLVINTHTGTTDFNTRNLTIEAYFNCTGTGTRTVSLGSGTWTFSGSNRSIIDFTTTTNLTLSTNTVTFDCTYSGSTGTRTIYLAPGSASTCPNIKVSAGTDIVAITASKAVRNLDFTGFAGTITATAKIIYGDLKIPTGITVTSGSTWTLSATSGTKAIVCVPGLGGAVTFDGNGGTFQLGANLSTTGAISCKTGANFTCVNGANNYTITASMFGFFGAGIWYPGSGTHIITGAGTFASGGYIYGAAAAGGTIKFTDSSSTNITFNMGGQAFGNVWFDRGGSTAYNSVTGSNAITPATDNIYNSILEFKDTGTAAHIDQFTSAGVITFSSFNVNGSSGQLITLQTNNAGFPMMMKMASGTSSCSYLTVKDIVVGGGATWTAGATSTVGAGCLGWTNCRVEPSRYWIAGGDGNWNSVTNWSTGDSGANGASVPDGDTNVFFTSNSGAGTSTVNANSPCRNLDFTGFTGTFAGASQLYCSGSIILGSGMTNNYTGLPRMVVSFNDHTITFNGKRLTTGGLRIESGSGDVSFADAPIITGAFTLISGSFSTGNFDYECSTFTTSQSKIQILNLGSSVITPISTSGSALVINLCPDLTFNAGTSTFKFNDTSNGNYTINTGNKTFYKLWFNRGASTGSIQHAAGGTFTEYIDTGTGSHTHIFLAGASYTFGKFSVSGGPGKLITLTSTSTATFGLVKSGGGNVYSSSVKFLHAVCTPAGSWFANSSVNEQTTSVAGSGCTFVSGISFPQMIQ